MLQGSLTQRDLHTFFVSSPCVSDHISSYHTSCRPCAVWVAAFFFLSARKKREPKTQTTRTTPGRRRRKTNGRNPGVERVERLVRLNVESTDEEDNAMTTTSPIDASSRGKRDVGIGGAWTTTTMFREEVEKRLKRVADEARKTNKPRAFTGWLREEKRFFGDGCHVRVFEW